MHFNPLWLLSLLVQAGLIVHVVKTGRNYLWIGAIGFIPFAGSVAYVVVELLPELFGGRGARRASAGVRRIIDPNRDLRRASAEVAISGNVDARRRLGDELFERGQYGEAIEVYAAGLTGVFEHDPTLLFGLARAEFARENYSAARTALQRLKEHNPEFNSGEVKLLLARTLEAEGDLTQAEREYAAAAPAFPGAEARLRYGLLLKRLGKSDEARLVFKDLIDGAKLGPAHYRRAQAEWLDRARREL